VKKINIIILLIILGLVLMGGCQSDKPNPDTSELPSEYFPLTAGSYWEYEGEGNEFASFTRKVLFTKENLAQTTEDNGGTVMTRIYETNDNKVTNVYLAGEDYNPENLLEKGYTPNENNIMLQAPLKAGTAWDSNGVNKSIVAVDAVVETPAGKFDNCIKVEIPSSNDTMYQYFKKGVGMVKQEFIAGDMTVTSTLKKYEIK
jgi:hypothetical protein